MMTSFEFWVNCPFNFFGLWVCVCVSGLLIRVSQLCHLWWWEISYTVHRNALFMVYTRLCGTPSFPFLLLRFFLFTLSATVICSPHTQAPKNSSAQWKPNKNKTGRKIQEQLVCGCCFGAEVWRASWSLQCLFNRLWRMQATWPRFMRAETLHSSGGLDLHYWWKTYTWRSDTEKPREGERVKRVEQKREGALNLPHFVVLLALFL